MKRGILILIAIAVCCLLRPSQCEATAYAYISDDQSPYIVDIKIADLTIVDFIDLPKPLKGYPYPLGVTVTRDGEVYVANRGANAVYVIDADGVVSDVEFEDLTPVGVAASCTGDYVYVTSREGRVSKINTSGGYIEPFGDVLNPEVGDNPIGVAVSPEGDVVWVANYESGSVSIIDANGDVDTIEDIGENPVGVAVTPRTGDYVYVTSYAEGTLSVIDTFRRQEVTATSPRPNVGNFPLGVAVSPDGSLVYVASLYLDEGAIFVIDTSKAPDHFQLIDRIKPVGERPVGVALTPDGDYLVVTNRGDGSSNGSVYVIRVSNRQIVDIREDFGERPASFGQFIGSISVPEAPTDLTATTESESQIDLSWADNSFDESGFEIELKRISQEGDETDTKNEYGTTATVTVGPNVTTYSHSNLEPDTTYSYRVRAYNDHGDSDYSDEADATTAIILKAPTNLTATDVSHSRIRLAWTDNSVGESGVEIERMKISEDTDSDLDNGDSDTTNSDSGTADITTAATGSFTKIDEVGANVTSYRDVDVEPYTTYRYRVQAYDDAGGVSGYSNEFEKRTKDDCFIATAAYGSLVEPHVVTLRHFRDTYLLPHTLGCVFVRTYYAISPPIANYVSRHETLRAVIRASLLPLVAFSYSMLHLGLTLTLTILAFIALSPVGLHWLYQRKKRSHKAAV